MVVPIAQARGVQPQTYVFAAINGALALSAFGLNSFDAPRWLSVAGLRGARRRVTRKRKPCRLARFRLTQHDGGAREASTATPHRQIAAGASRSRPHRYSNGKLE